MTTHPSTLPEAGEGKRGEGGYLGYLLRQAAAAYSQRVERLLADLDVTAPQFAVLTILRAYPGLSGADLARLALLTPQTVSVIVANLERAGSIARRPDEMHGRIRKIALTGAGLATLSACTARVRAVETALSESLTDEEERVLRRCLVRIATDDPSETPHGGDAGREREPGRRRDGARPPARLARIASRGAGDELP